MDKNNFDGVRIGLALIVVMAHVCALTQSQELKFFESLFDADFAVKGFFAISGFLVMKSYLTSKNIYDYVEKRCRRIYPAYITVVLLCLLIGVFTTQLEPIDFIRASETLRYFIANAVFLNFLQPTLPSTFVDNPVQAINGSLWTIKVEVMLYFCAPFIYFLFKKIGSVKATFILFLSSVAWVYFFTSLYKGHIGADIARQFPGQIAYFVMGSILAVNARVLSKIKWIAVFSLVSFSLVENEFARLFIEPICYSAVVIFLATYFKNMNFGRWGDISYGIYLYHFPIIQLLIFIGVFEMDVWLGVCATFLITIGLALCSWHFIEKRFLKRTSYYLEASAHVPPAH
ncbi:MAG: acyltransferase [Ottowia sp.]|nr:acyltransferase [Ottowia sp.]